MASPNGKGTGEREDPLVTSDRQNSSGPRSPHPFKPLNPGFSNPFKVHFKPLRNSPPASTSSALNIKKRRASKSPERAAQDDPCIDLPDSDLAFRKKRFILKHGTASQPGPTPQVAGLVNPLDVLANAAASATRLPISTSTSVRYEPASTYHGNVEHPDVGSGNSLTSKRPLSVGTHTNLSGEIPNIATSPSRQTIPAYGSQGLPASFVGDAGSHKTHLHVQTSAQDSQLPAISVVTNSLDVIATAALSSPRLPVPISRPRPLAPLLLKKTTRRIVLLNSPFPSPLIAAKKFDLLAALMSHVDILLNITSYLSPPTLLNLYSISAPFHYLMDSHLTSFIMACTRTWAPNADKFFPWWCYRQLCIEDPAQRPARKGYRNVSWTNKQGLPVKTTQEAYAAASTEGEGWNLDTDPNSNTSTQVRKPIVRHSVPADKDPVAIKKRDVPSFRWLKMVAYRESVSREIIGWLAVHGHRVPRHEGVAAVKKMWFLIDIPISAPRVALIHNTAYFPANTLIVLQTMFIKLDMLYTDPLRSAGGEYRMREMLLSERSLTTLWNYLRGADGTSRLDITRLWIRHGYRRPQPVRPMTQQQQTEYEAKAKMPIMGVPAKLVGRWGFECWGLGQNRLIRPDELVAKEGVRRRLNLQREYLRMISSGYLGLGLEALPVVKKENVVLSLIRRRKNEAKARNEREQEEQRSGGAGKGKGRESAFEEQEDEDENMDEADEVGNDTGDEVHKIDDLQKLVMMHLTG